MIFIEKGILANGPKLKKLLWLVVWFGIALKDINGKGLDLFNEDLDYAKKTKSYYFPTILFSIDNEIKTSITGLQPYEKFEEIIREFIPNVTKTTSN
jgi:hypothetical protein